MNESSRYFNSRERAELGGSVVQVPTESNEVIDTTMELGQILHIRKNTQLYGGTHKGTRESNEQLGFRIEN